MKVIAIGAAVALVAIIGILFGILSGQLDPEKVKAELKSKIEEIEKMPPEQIIEKYRKLQELQKDPNYDTKICGAIRKQLDKAVEDARPIAERQQKADEEVAPFLQEYDQAKSGLNQAKAQQLLDKVSALINDYGTTPYFAKLEAIRKELLAWLEANTSTDTPEGAWLPMKTSADRAADDDDHKRASELVAAFEKQYGSKLSSTLKRELDSLKSSLARKLERFIKDTVKTAKDLHERGETPEAQTKLKQAMEKVQGLEGFSELEGLLKSMGGN